MAPNQVSLCIGIQNLLAYAVLQVKLKSLEKSDTVFSSIFLCKEQVRLRLWHTKRPYCIQRSRKMQDNLCNSCNVALLWCSVQTWLGLT